MLNEENKELCWQVMDAYGLDHQLQKLIEECAELIQAVCKMQDNENDATFSNYLEEMVDVVVVIQELFLDYAMSDYELNSRSKAKLLRTLERRKHGQS